MKCRNIRLIFVMCYDTWHLYINFDFYINYLNISNQNIIITKSIGKYIIS